MKNKTIFLAFILIIIFFEQASAAKELAFEKISSAITTGNLSQLKILLKEKKDLNEPIIADETLLMHATSEGQFELVRWLHKSKVNLNTATKDGHRALSYAILGGHGEIARWLIQQGAEVNFRHDDLRLNPFFDAITVNDLQTVKALLNKHSEFLISEARDRDSARVYTPLQWAHRYGQDEIEIYLNSALASKKRLK